MKNSDVFRLTLTKVASGSYIADMRAVGLKVLKNKLSEYVRLVASGETVLIINRDAVVAEIVPPRPGVVVADALLEDAYHEGLITPPVDPGGAVPSTDPVMTFEEVMRELEESRRER